MLLSPNIIYGKLQLDVFEVRGRCVNVPNYNVNMTARSS